MKNPLREQRLSKKFVALLLCITVCFSLAVGSYLTRGTVYVGNLTEVWANPPFSSPNWQVGQVNATYFFTQNCTSGQWAYEGTNATLAIQYALDRGGKIVISSGIYKTNGNLEPKSNTYLYLEPDTIIRKVNSAGNQITTLSQASSLMYRKSSYKLENFTVDGGTWDYNKPNWYIHRGDANWTTYYSKLHGIFLGEGGAYSPENIVVKNLIVQNILGFGIMMYMCHNVRVDNCKVYEPGDNGISISASDNAVGSRWVHDAVVSNCFVRGARDVGINVFYGKAVRFIGCSSILNTQTAGFYSHWGIAAEGKSSQIVIDDCYLEGNDYNIVVSGGSKNITISNCVVNGTNGSSRYGVETQDCQNVVIMGSQFLGCGVPFGTYTPTQTYDVEFAHNLVVSGYMYIHGHGITIADNNIYSTSTNGAIYLHGAIDVIIQGNNFRGTYGVRDFGIVSTQVVIQYNDLSELTNTKIWLQGTVDLTLIDNKGIQKVISESSYIVGKYNSTFYYAENMTTQKFDIISSNSAVVLQYALNNLGSSGGTIFIKPPFTCTSNVKINQSDVTITNGLQGSYQTDADVDSCDFTDLEVEALTTIVENIKLMGLSFKGLTFDASHNFAIRNVVIDGGRVFRNDNTNKGVMVVGSGNVDGFVDTVRWVNTIFKTAWIDVNDGATKGVLSWTDARYSTGWSFTNCRFNLGSTNTTMFFFDDNSDAQLSYNGCMIYTDPAKIGLKIFYCAGGSAPWPSNSPMVYWIGGHWEWHGTGIFYALADGAGGDNRLQVRVTDVTVSSEGNMTLFDVDEDHITTLQLVSVIGSSFACTTFSIGDLPADADLRKSYVGNQGLVDA